MSLADASDLHVVVVDQLDARLGRQVVHDPRSRAFPMPDPVDRSTWKRKVVRLYDPWPRPNQEVGCCTGCAKAMELNAVGNRRPGRILGMDTALEVYSLATTIDPWPGSYPPTDTGSSGLAASRAAQTLGLAGEYRWALGGGADAVVQAIMGGRTVSVGTWWYEGLFTPRETKVGGQEGHYRIEPTGRRVGGHQYLVRGYDDDTDMVLVRSWWGTWANDGDAWMKREHLTDLLADDGDAHYQLVKKQPGLLAHPFRMP